MCCAIWAALGFTRVPLYTGGWGVVFPCCVLHLRCDVRCCLLTVFVAILAALGFMRAPLYTGEQKRLLACRSFVASAALLYSRWAAGAQVCGRVAQTTILYYVRLCACKPGLQDVRPGQCIRCLPRYVRSRACCAGCRCHIRAHVLCCAVLLWLAYHRAAGVTWKAQNQAAVLLAAGQKGHRYTFPHAKISTAPPVMNRVFGQAVDAQLQVRRLCGVHAASFTMQPLQAQRAQFLA